MPSSTTLGGGEMGAYVLNFPWDKTELGPLHSWPHSLKTALNLILNSQHPMWIGWGRNKTFLYNDAYIPILGPSKHPWALGRPFHEVWSEIQDVCGPLANKVFEKGEATFVDHVRLFMRKPRADGSLYLKEEYYSFSYSPIYDESGKVGGLFCPSNSVTDKILGERRLQTLTILSANALAERTTESASAAILKTLSKNRDDIPFALLYLIHSKTGQPVLQGSFGFESKVADDLRNQFLCPIDPVVRNGQFEVISLKNFKNIPLGLANQPVAEAVLLPLRVSRSEIAGVLVVGVNPAREIDTDYQAFFELISRHASAALQGAKIAEEERRRLESLAEIDRAKTAFFSNVSHEFRTPLTLILGPLEDSLLEREEPLIGRQRERQEFIYRNSVRLMKLVNSLLDYSRIEARRTKATYRPTNLSQLTAEIASVFRSAIEKAGLKFSVLCPEFGEPVYVDREMWEKIILNLLSNAFKFTFHGEINVILRREGNRVQLRVQDTGVGISEIELLKIFDRFHRVEGSKGRSHEGSGIGLALVQELVKLHGGGIRVESALNLGSTFIVEIPLGYAHLPAESIQTDEASLGSTEIGRAYVEEALSWLPSAEESLKVRSPSRLEPSRLEPSHLENDEKFRILVADDNADMRGYVQGLLSKIWIVEAVADGELAFESAKANPPDIILSDVMMPKMDGFQLIQALRSDPATQGIPVILLSARAGQESTIVGLEAGADDYLVKPFTANELIARVKTQLRLLQSRKEAENAQEELYEFFMQAPAPLVILLGPEHRFFLVNPAYERFVGRQNITGKEVLEVFTRKEVGSFVDRLDQVYRTGEPYIGQELPLSLSNELGEMQKRYINVGYHPFRERDGTIKGILAIHQDVTDQVIARQKVEGLATALQAAIDLRDEFLSIASHELKTPITSIKLQLQMMQRQMKMGFSFENVKNKLERTLDISLQQIKRLTNLIEDLLDVSTIQAGKLNFNCELLDLNRMVEEVLERFTDQLESANSLVHVDIPPGLTPCWDRARMEQVIENLISNAIKYAPGKPIHIRARVVHNNVEISVQDFGPGIVKERIDSIFERFERATSFKNISGLGLGLFIVKRIVLGHSGQIWVESEIGKGTTFFVVLPLNMPPGKVQSASG